MRLPVAVLTALLLVPATAQAGTVGLEGTELVLRSAPGQEDLLEAEREGRRLVVEGVEGGELGYTPGPGCERARRVVTCSLDGVTGLRVLLGDGDDIAAVRDVELALTAELGPGSDDFDGSATSLHLAAGEGSDRVGFVGGGGLIDLGPGEDYGQVTIPRDFTGPLVLEGGEGRDVLFADGRSRSSVTLSGGAGDDELRVATNGTRTGLGVVCGPGRDATFVRPVDRPGEGCAPHLAGPLPRTVSRRFGATLTGPARGTVTFHRDTRPASRGAVLLARGTYDARATSLRTRLKTTRAGRRWIGRDPDLRLFVTVRTRAGGDRGEVSFNARLAR
jgi:hypothetical protein